MPPLLARLRSLTFFDPACGCGNFLVIAYREVRRLELDAVEALQAIAVGTGKQTILVPANALEAFGDAFKMLKGRA